MRSPSVEQVLDVFRSALERVNRRICSEFGDNLGKALRGISPEKEQAAPQAPNIDEDVAHLFEYAVPYAAIAYGNYHASQHRYLPRAVVASGKDGQRADLVDALLEAHALLKMRKETLFLAVSCLDRVLASETVKSSELLTLAAASLFLAGKYEEQIEPEIVEIIDAMCPMLSTKARRRMAKAIQAMERKIFTAIDGMVGMPTSYIFLVRYMRAAGYEFQRQVQAYALYLCELALYRGDFSRMRPSEIAAGVVLACRIALAEGDAYPTELHGETQHSYADILPIAGMLLDLAANPELKGHNLEFFAKKKYASRANYHVSINGVASLAAKRKMGSSFPENPRPNKKRRIE